LNRNYVIVTIEGRRLRLGLAPNNVSLVAELKPPASFDQQVQRAVEAEGMRSRTASCAPCS
jgi:hypothetical protein